MSQVIIWVAEHIFAPYLIPLLFPRPDKLPEQFWKHYLALTLIVCVVVTLVAYFVWWSRRRLTFIYRPIRSADDAFRISRQWTRTLSATLFLSAALGYVIGFKQAGYNPNTADLDIVYMLGVITVVDIKFVLIVSFFFWVLSILLDRGSAKYAAPFSRVVRRQILRRR